MLLVSIVFVSVFAVLALLLLASGASQAETSKQTHGRLEAAIAAINPALAEEVVDIRKREKLSSIPLLNRLLSELKLADRLRTLLHQADSTSTPATVVLYTIALWLAAEFALSLKVRPFWAAALIGLIPTAIPIWYLFYQRDKRFQKFEEGLPAALDLIVSGLRAGHSIVSALELVGRDAPNPIGKEFQLCFDEQNYGLELRDALENLSSRVPIPDVRIILTAILVQKETGGNLAEVLDKTAHLIRERFRLKREIRIRTAQGRLTGWILSLLPPGLGLLLFIIHPEVISLLWHRPLGVKLLWTGFFMTITGALIIQKIVRIRV
jgi:tight adherence protein B